MEKTEGPENHTDDLHSSSTKALGLWASHLTQQKRMNWSQLLEQKAIVFHELWLLIKKKKKEKSNSVHHFLVYLLSLQLKIQIVTLNI